MTVDKNENLIITLNGRTQYFCKNDIKDALNSYLNSKQEEQEAKIKLKTFSSHIETPTFCAQYNREQEETTSLANLFKDIKPEVNTGLVDNGKALRYDKDKVRHDLIPSWALNELGKVYTFGAKKYADNNWRKGMKWSRVIGSLKRHLNAIEQGEDFDKESELYHASHVAWNAITLLEYYKIYPQGDDRQHDYLNTVKIGLDIDEVLCDFVTGWSEVWGEKPNPDMWNYDREMGKRFAEMKEKGTLDEFYLNLKPKLNANNIPFEPHCYVTSRPIDTKITEQWLKKHNFPEVKVYTVPVGTSKIDVIKQSGIDIFVDDRYENFVELNNAGICTYLFDAKHNKRYSVGYKRISSLEELI
tara:strand:+ start:8294 stop:9367 length:1074 start_codon:yes stop_codon:yes gene_type:complete